MEYIRSGRQPQWNISAVEDNLNGRQSQWNTTFTEDKLNGRQSKLKSTSMEEYLNERRPPHNPFNIPKRVKKLT